MSKILYTAILILLYSSIILGQSCFNPEETVTFSSQFEVDEFIINHPNCVELEGNLKIEGDDITNLAGLDNITRINGTLTIENCKSLESLEGLESLTNLRSMSI